MPPVAVVAFLLAAAPAVSPQSAGTYRLRLMDVDAPHVDVQARVRLAGGRLAAGFGGAFDWERGWGQFVQDLEARDTDGRALAVDTGGDHATFHWVVSSSHGPVTGEVDLSYRVALSYAHRDWDFGNEQAGIVLDGALYTVTKGLFLGSDVPGERRVTFDVPDAWRIAAPWTREADGRSFRVPDLLALQNNTLVLGDFARFELEEEGFDFTLALPGRMGAARSLVEGAMQRVLPLYLELFPDTPRVPYLMTVYYAEQEDGEAFTNGATFTTTQVVSESTSLLWASFLAHELFHFWNGQRLRGTPRSERQWFSEGFTEYYANLALVNGGVVDEAGFVKKLEQHLANYLYFMSAPPFAGVTLRQAGSAKGTNRLGVYDGGWATAFVLDNRIRSATDGARSLDDYMGVLFEAHALTGEPYVFDDLVAHLVDVAGPELEGFLEAHVDGREVLPVVETLRAYGLIGLSKPYAGELYVLPDEEAGEDERAEWRWLTRERFR
jgi:predicted metalloprotease with PDZ domain